MSADPQPKKPPGRVRKFLLGCTLGGAGLLLLFILLTIALALLFPDDPQTSPATISPALTSSPLTYSTLPTRTSRSRTGRGVLPTITAEQRVQRTAYAAARLTATATPFAPARRPTATPDAMSSMEEIVDNVNSQVPAGMTVTWSNMVGYCETLRNIGWSFDKWVDLTETYAELNSNTSDQHFRWTRHFSSVWVGLEEEAGSVRSGCRAFGVR